MAAGNEILGITMTAPDNERCAGLRILSRRGYFLIGSFSFKAENGNYELDFESNPRDIINSEHVMFDQTVLRRTTNFVKPLYHKSLREYCSILFLKPRMKIVLRGEKVKVQLIAKSLSQTEKDVYRPTWLDRPVPITFGFSSNREDSGIMMYHNNRLIKPYCQVGIQKQNNELGVGVVGVVAVDFLDPIHNKQDFNKTDQYNTFMGGLGNKLSDYWYTKVGDGDNPELNIECRPDWTWVQCENPNCLKWRRLADHVDPKDLPDKWYCYNNADPMFNRCDIKEEPEDEDELLQRATYQKKKKKTPASKIKEKEVELRQKEQFLAAKEQIVNNLPNVTLKQLEATQRKLREAEQREQENLAYIRMLKQRENTIRSKKEHKEPTPAKKKRVPPERTSSSSSSEEEETSPQKKQKMKVRIPFKKPSYAQKASKRTAVVEGSDDEEVVFISQVNVPKRRKKGDEDVKPDVTELDMEMEVTEISETVDDPTPAAPEEAEPEPESPPGPEPITVTPVPGTPPAEEEDTGSVTCGELGTAIPVTPLTASTAATVSPTAQPSGTDEGDVSNGPALLPMKAAYNKRSWRGRSQPSLPPSTTASFMDPSMSFMMNGELDIPNLQEMFNQSSYPDLPPLQVSHGLTLPTITTTFPGTPRGGRGRSRGRVRNVTLHQNDAVNPNGMSGESEEFLVCKAELDKTRKTLLELRQNVHQLLEFIVPNQPLGSIHMVDQVVSEMLKIKKEMLDSQAQEGKEIDNESVANGEAVETDQ